MGSSLAVSGLWKLPDFNETCRSIVCSQPPFFGCIGLGFCGVSLRSFQMHTARPCGYLIRVLSSLPVVILCGVRWKLINMNANYITCVC